MRAASLTALVAAAAAGPIDPEATSGESTPMVEPYGESVAVPFVTAASSEEGSGGAVVLTLLLLLLLGAGCLCCVVCHSSPSAIRAAISPGRGSQRPPFTRLVEEDAETHTPAGPVEAPGSFAALAQEAKEEAQRAKTSAAAAEGAQRFFEAEAEAELAAARAAAEALLAQPMFGRRSSFVASSCPPSCA